MIEKIINEIKTQLEEKKPTLESEQKQRMHRIINPDIEDYEIFGLKVADTEKIIKIIHEKFDCTFEEATEVYRLLSRYNIEEYKFAAFLFLNRFKKHFSSDTINVFYEGILKHCHTWSMCDSSCIRVVGPFLAKKGNEFLARNTINEWSDSENLWIKRASMVILLKNTMVHKDFEEEYVFNLVKKMLTDVESNYIEKGIGWLLKTCSKYKPDIIMNYLIRNKDQFTRLILRYASEKLPNDKRAIVLKKN
ncbi:MAG: DNA alkylation repair protein [Candidatus Lokiarchaeota archaeon]|nr:DNA alkylation repair protein [Candidatus Lokiarchaeota archaeon]